MNTYQPPSGTHSGLQNPYAQGGDAHLRQGQVPPPPMYPRERPFGVTLLAIFQFIKAFFYLLAGFLLLFLWPMIKDLMDEYAFAIPSEMLDKAMAIADTVVPVIGIVLIVFGIIVLIYGVGLWNLRPWARTIALTFTVIFLVFDALTFNVIMVVIDLIILYYLTRPYVKEAFGVY